MLQLQFLESLVLAAMGNVTNGNIPTSRQNPNHFLSIFGFFPKTNESLGIHYTDRSAVLSHDNLCCTEEAHKQI